MADICYCVLNEHRDVNMLAQRKCKNCLTDDMDVFKFMSFAGPLLLFVVALYQLNKWLVFLDARGNKSEAISHEMTPVRGESSASLHSNWSIQDPSAHLSCFDVQF